MTSNVPKKGDAFNQIIDLLPQLSDDDLAKLPSRIKSLASLGGNQNMPATAGAGTASASEAFALRCISQAMERMGVAFSSPHMLSKAQGNGALRAKVPEVMAFIAQAGREQTVQHAVLSLGVQLLYDDMARCGPVSARTMVAQFHRIPAVINDAFPGYAQAGMLSWIVSRSGKRPSRIEKDTDQPSAA